MSRFLVLSVYLVYFLDAGCRFIRVLPYLEIIHYITVIGDYLFVGWMKLERIAYIYTLGKSQTLPADVRSYTCRQRTQCDRTLYTIQILVNRTYVSMGTFQQQHGYFTTILMV